MRIEQHTRKGRMMAAQISKKVDKDLYLKKQRFEIFISKMEQLQAYDKRFREFEDAQVLKM